MRLLRALPGLAVLLCLLLWGPAFAAEPITVISSEHESAFPEKVTFTLRARAEAEITRATLYYRLGDSPVLSYARPDLQPGPEVKVEYVLKGQRDYLPPGVELSYYWIVEDAAGHKLQTEPAVLLVDDMRFQWRELREGQLLLRWYEGDEDFARELLAAGTQALERLSKDTGVTVDRPVKVFIYATQKDLLGALEPKAQEWTGGRSFSELRIVLLVGSPSSSGLAFARRAVPHELSHVVIHQATDNPYGSIPRWLDEGLAMSAEGQLESTYQASLERAVRERKLISLRSLGSNFPADPDQAALSYAESHSVVQFIIDTYGRDGMSRLLAVFREGSTYDDATQQALGLSVKELEVAWKKRLGIVETPTAVPAAQPGGTAPAVTTDSIPAPSPSPASSPGAGGCAAPLVALAGAVLLARLRLGLPG